MDTRLLREWLGLPPGDWPPPPYALLGLPELAPRDAAQPAALRRMALLRPHQLAHPELVTEGMNRLARAVILVESASPAAVDLAPEPEAAPTRARRAARVRARPTPPAAPTPAAPTRPAVEVRDEPLLLVTEVPAPPPGLGRAGRRLFYRELAALRALVRALDAARATAADPAEPVVSPLAVTAFAEAAIAIGVSLARPGLPDEARQTCEVLSAICRTGHPAGVLRSLTDSQRGRVAREWAAARGWALGRQQSVRAALRARPAFAIIAPRGCRGAATPGRLLAGVAILAGVVAVARVARVVLG